MRGLGWLGVRTQHFEEMVHLYRDVLGLDAFQEDQASARFRLGDGTEIHVYGPTDQDHRFFGEAPVVGIVVDDVEIARPRMEAEGIAFIGPIQRRNRTLWSHFRGPDGNVYEIISR